MNKFRISIAIVIVLAFFASSNFFQQEKKNAQSKPKKGSEMKDKIVKSDDEWKNELTSEQYHVLREKGTERPFTGKYWDTKEKGVYKCAGCGQELFTSDTKYESECGWPSFYAPEGEKKIDTKDDDSFLMNRTEVLCSKCGGHLGHVFNDGPKPTGLRYCINSAALEFEKKDSNNK